MNPDITPYNGLICIKLIKFYLLKIYAPCVDSALILYSIELYFGIQPSVFSFLSTSTF